MSINKSDSQFVLSWAKKLRAIRLLGGACVRCGADDFRVLEFHHRAGRKKQNDTCVNYLRLCRWSDFWAEASKCEVICSNCHPQIHYGAAIDSVRRAIKKELLEYLDVSSCCSCGFDGGEDYVALDFHHVNSNEKQFTISDEITIQKRLVDKIIQEAAKCQVLCKNCHALERVDTDRIALYMSAIEEKSNSYKEHKKIDHQEVMRMLNGGMRPVDISRELGCAKSSVTYIVSRQRKLREKP